MTEAKGIDKAEQRPGVVLGEFRAALTAAKEKRAVVRLEAKLHDLALAAGQPELGGFAPVAAAAKRQMELKRRVAVSPGEGRSIAAMHLAVPEDVPEREMPRAASDAPSYRVAMAQARHEAAVARERRRAEREALHLPVRGRGVEKMSFAPYAADGVVGREALPPAKGRHALPVPGLRRGRGAQGAAAMAQEAPHDPGAAPESQHLEVRPVLAQETAAPLDIKRALDEYFFRQSRLPPNGGAGFNPLLSPIWAGLKIPG